MKKMLISLLAIFSVVLLSTHAFAVNVDKTVNVTASATITGTTSLSSSPASITFSNVTADALAASPITLTYTSNYNPWQIAIYTTNCVTEPAGMPTGPVPVHANGGPYQKGGLVTPTTVGASAYNTVPLKWVAQNPATAAPSATSPNALLNFTKDKADELSAAGKNDDWSTAFGQGYANIAFGNASGGNCVDPTNTTAGASQYKGDAVSGSIKVYLYGMFLTSGMTPPVQAPAGNYSTNIGFDLYHQ